MIGFIQENRAEVVLNQITIGYAVAIPRGVIHFVQNLDCSPFMQIVAYNDEDPGLLTLSLNMFRSIRRFYREFEKDNSRLSFGCGQDL
ncbi:hypothetical protein I4U23_015808 [Adineta vaga]|nr:hypothetical protein I4U23_015808 [Adineta vaga]